MQPDDERSGSEVNSFVDPSEYIIIDGNSNSISGNE